MCLMGAAGPQDVSHSVSLCNTDGFLDLERVEYVRSIATPARSMVTSSGAVCGMRLPRAVLLFIRAVLNEVFPSSSLFTEAFHIVLVASFCAAIGTTLVKASPQQPPASAAGPNSVEGVTVPMEPVVPSEFRGDL